MRPLTSQELIEIKKCRMNPWYFLSTYGFIKDPVRGRIPFELYEYQKVCLNHFLQHVFNIVLKSRQMGMSWLVAGFALWLCLFFEDKKVLMISIKAATAKALLKKVKYIYDNLPPFLRGELEERNMSRMVFCTGSEIESVPTSEDAGRSESLSLLIIDEAAFVRWMDQIWTAAYPTLSTGGQAILLSTPNGMGNEYYKFWSKALEGKSLFNPIRLHWWYHPERSYSWYEIQEANMSSMQLAQEVLGDFIASGNLVFDITALRALQEECSMITPIEIMYADEIDKRENCGLHIFSHPKPGSRYIISVDTAKGGASDYHAAHVLDDQTGFQAAEYRTRIPLPLFNSRLYALACAYNYGCVGIENNYGAATILHFIQNDYPNLYEYENPLKGGRRDLGFPTNTLTRPILIDELENSIREGVSGVQGIRTVNELMSFAWNMKGKPEAISGKHDDLVMALGIGRYIRRLSVRPVDMPIILS